MISKIISTIFPRNIDKERATDLYGDIVVQARSPFFYTDLGVPDTVEGRFDMITLHMFLVLHRLKQDPVGKEFGQKLFNAMFKNMDHSLREMGVGDLSVGKKVRGLAESFYGRLGAYEGALASENADELAETIARNIHGKDHPGPESITLSRYIRECVEALNSQSLERLMMGIVSFKRIDEVALTVHEEENK